VAIAVGIAVGIGVVLFFAWAMLQPGAETEMGRENKARREAKKAARRGETEGQPEA
jgi:hypothetical protein